MNARQPAEGARRAAVVRAGAVQFPAYQGVLHVLLELEVLFAGLCLFVGLAAAAIELVQGVDVPPGVEGLVAGLDLRVQIPVSEVQVPVGVLQVADEIPQADLEIGQADVGPQPRHEYAVEHAGAGAGPRNAIEIDAAALEEGMPHFGFHGDVPRPALDLVAYVVVVVEIDHVPQRELVAGHGPLGDMRIEVVVFLREEAVGSDLLVVVFLLGLLEDHAGGKLGVESAERRFRAILRVGFLDRHPVRRRNGFRARSSVPPRSCMTRAWAMAYCTTCSRLMSQYWTGPGFRTSGGGGILARLESLGSGTAGTSIWVAISW